MATFVQWHFQPAEACDSRCEKKRKLEKRKLEKRKKILEKIKINSNLQDTVDFNFILGKIKAESQDLGKSADVYTTWK